MADWGMSANATSTLQHALVSASAPNVGPPVLYYIADYCYAGELHAYCSCVLPASQLDRGLSVCADLFRCGAVHCEADVSCCADTWYTNGTVSSPDSGFEGLTSGGGQSRSFLIAMQLCSHVTTCYLLPAGTWQPVWDSWQVRRSNPLPRWKCLS